MTYRKIFLVLFTAAAIISASRGIAVLARSTSAPAQTSSLIGLDEAVSVPGMKTTDEMIKFWQARFERDPRDFISLTFLGDAYIRKARETGDVNEYARAEAVLQKALDMHPRYEVAQAYLSTVRYVQHD